MTTSVQPSVAPGEQVEIYHWKLCTLGCVPRAHLPVSAELSFAQTCASEATPGPEVLLTLVHRSLSFTRCRRSSKIVSLFEIQKFQCL